MADAVRGPNGWPIVLCGGCEHRRAAHGLRGCADGALNGPACKCPGFTPHPQYPAPVPTNGNPS